MRRREFITGLGGAAAAWPVVARAQQAGRIRRIGVLTNQAENDPVGRDRVAVFTKKLQELGWIDGRNVRIEVRWSAADNELLRKNVAELVALAPDAILAVGGPATLGLQQATRTISIVFVQVVDPVAAGFVSSVARPGGNITGFMNFEYSLSGKWLELLKQIAPNIRRVAVLRDLSNPSGLGQFGALQSAAPSFGVELMPVGMRDVSEIERGISAFAREPNGGMIVPAGVAGTVYREPIILLASRHRLPAVYSERAFVTGGGLASYGPDRADPYSRSVTYVDRILKGDKPADLPVQAPTKYELAINLKTAKALGLDVPLSLQQRADEVIE